MFLFLEALLKIMLFNALNIFEAEEKIHRLKKRKPISLKTELSKYF